MIGINMTAIQKRLISIRVREEKFSGINALSACLSGIASECLSLADRFIFAIGIITISNLEFGMQSSDI